MQARKEYVEKIVLQAGELIRKRIKEDLTINEKENNRSDLVTNVDLEVERFLVDKIAAKFPNDSFLTEEKTVRLEESDNVWIIDPIDGTTNFIYLLRDFAISIALYVKGVGKLGIAYDVMADELFVGVANEGVTLNGEKVSPLKKESLEQSIVDVNSKVIINLKDKGIANLDQLLPNILSFRSLGSAVLRIIHIGLNRIHVYIAANLHIWDIAAAIIILEELGGTHNFVDKELAYNSDSFFFIAANNNEVKEEILEKYFNSKLQE